jgi:hypothetical protein
MYDFSQHSFNGEAVAYAALPNYALDLIDADSQLNPAKRQRSASKIRHSPVSSSTTRYR